MVLGGRRRRKIPGVSAICALSHAQTHSHNNGRLQRQRPSFPATTASKPSPWIDEQAGSRSIWQSLRLLISASLVRLTAEISRWRCAIRRRPAGRRKNCRRTDATETRASTIRHRRAKAVRRHVGRHFLPAARSYLARVQFARNPPALMKWSNSLRRATVGCRDCQSGGRRRPELRASDARNSEAAPGECFAKLVAPSSPACTCPGGGRLGDWCQPADQTGNRTENKTSERTNSFACNSVLAFGVCSAARAGTHQERRDERQPSSVGATKALARKQAIGQPLGSGGAGASRIIALL